MFAYLSKKVSETMKLMFFQDIHAQQFSFERGWLELGEGISSRWWRSGSSQSYQVRIWKGIGRWELVHEPTFIGSSRKRRRNPVE